MGKRQITVRVTTTTRDSLAQVAETLGGVSFDEAIRTMVFQYQTAQALAALMEDPEALADYRNEAEQLNNVDMEPTE